MNALIIDVSRGTTAVLRHGGHEEGAPKTDRKRGEPKPPGGRGGTL